MLFNSFPFLIFFVAVLALYWSAPRSARGAVLLSASILFYGLWIPSYLLLLALELGVNYWLYRQIIRRERKMPYLVASVVFTLTLLAYFKYSAMIIETLIPVLSAGFGVSPRVPDLFLPLGISFYSFQIIALAVDTYHDRGPQVERFSRYALFISFFPQLIAGPILRGHEFLPQLEAGGVATPERTRRGLWLLASGLVKKVIIADFLLAPYVDSIFGTPAAASAPLVVIAVYSFAFQIYYDFSGYTDMARGLACLLGFEIPLNFREPYLSRDPSEFWSRWHITLSKWLQDYLYVPLGGNRMGDGRTYLNLIITMVLGGLWHGAGWLFITWGALHGALLVVHRFFSKQRIPPEAPLRLADAPRIFVLFQFTCFFWIFFRAGTMADAGILVGALFGKSWLTGWPVFQSSIVVACMVMHGLERYVRLRLGEILSSVARFPWAPLCEGLAFGAIVGLAIAVSGTGGEFIYFQF